MDLPSGKTIGNQTLSDIVEFLVADTLELDGVSGDFQASMHDSIDAAVGTLAEGGWGDIEYDEADRVAIIGEVEPVARAFFIELAEEYRKLFVKHVTPKFPTE